MKLGNAKTDFAYCTNIKCSSKDHCDRHESHWNFRKDTKYCFTELNEMDCVRKECEKYGIKI